MRRKRNKISSKLGLLFVIIILTFTSISVSYAHWEETLTISAEIETTEFGDGEIDPLIAFEDLKVSVGTGTIGYWKNHPDAWPVEEITIGGITYTKDGAIAVMKTPGKGDKTYDMFKQLTASKLNVLIGCESSCIDQTIIDADNWLITYPLGTGVSGGSQAWQIGEPLHTSLTDYNEGKLCAPHRDTVHNNNDFDYNDFIFGMDMCGSYVTDYLVKLDLIFEARARGAAYHHDLYINIPAYTFGVNGSYTIHYFETDGTLISTITGSFEDKNDINLILFQDTWDAMPANSPGPYSFSGNTVDGSGVQDGRTTQLIITFDGYFGPDDLDIGTMNLENMGIHAGNLFFDTYLYVTDTGEEIHTGDSRVLLAPLTWNWPQERAAIWDVYPFNSGTNEGVTEGNPPSFTMHWYTETPTSLKWDAV